MFEKVLVCLDGSPESEEILPYIVQESRHLTSVILLTVVDAPVVSLPIGVPGENMPAVQSGEMLEKFRQALVKDRPAYLEEKARPLREKGVPVAIEVLEGAPTTSAARVILDYARENGVTLLAVGTHGHGGWREIAMGSTAEYLLKNSGTPVLMVSPRERGRGKGKS